MSLPKGRLLLLHSNIKEIGETNLSDFEQEKSFFLNIGSGYQGHNIYFVCEMVKNRAFLLGKFLRQV